MGGGAPFELQGEPHLLSDLPSEVKSQLLSFRSPPYLEGELPYLELKPLNS